MDDDSEDQAAPLTVESIVGSEDVDYDSIDILTYDNCGIFDVENLIPFQQLLIASFKYNYLTTFDFLEYNRRLEIIDLGWNRIHTFANISRLRFLRDLNLEHNEISSLDELPDWPFLRFLNLSYNNLSTWPRFDHLESLESLELRHNKLKFFLHPSRLMRKLKKLDLCDNRLFRIPHGCNLRYLERLDVSYNLISSIPFAVDTLCFLKYFDISHNVLHDITYIVKLQTITTLNLSGNPYIRYSAEALMQSLPNLEVLDHEPAVYIPGEDYEDTMATFKLVSQRLISVSGPDAFKFLQGLTTNNIALVQQEFAASSHVLPSLFLASNGRIAAQALLSRGLSNHPNTFLLDIDSSAADGLIEVLNRRRLAAQVEIQLMHKVSSDKDKDGNGSKENVTVYAQFGSSLNDNDSDNKVQGLTKLIDPRIPHLKLQRCYALNQQIEEKVYPQIYYQLIMALHGLVENVAVAHLKVMPQDLNLQRFGYLCKSNKGCFVGQEYMNRIVNRTLINKHCLCLVFSRQLLEARESTPMTSWAPWMDSIALLDSLSAKIIAKKFAKDPKLVIENITTPQVAIQEATCKNLTVLVYYNTGFGLALAPRGLSNIQAVEINGEQHQIAAAL